jgi:CDP-glucose 4,6-dehydratase
MEPLSGYLLLAQRLMQQGPAYGGAWNFSPIENDARPVQWIADRLCALWGQGAAWKQDAHNGPHEAHYLKLNCTKAHQQLGWQPVWGLETALSEIVSWYRAQVAGEDPRFLTLRQITQHQRFQ